MHNSTPIEEIKNIKAISLRFATLHELDGRLGLVLENLHPDLRYVGASTFAVVKLDPYKLFELHCLYRLCACALHSSVVPLFSSTPSTNTTASSKMVRLSAEEAVKHAVTTLKMATVFLSAIRPDISRLPSITGFAMYVASVIYVKSLVAQRELTSAPSNTTNFPHIGRLKAAVSILDRLKDYWLTLNGPWAQLRALFLVATGLPLERLRSASPLARSVSNEDDLPTNYEKIAAAKNSPQDGVSDLHTYVADQETMRTRTSGSAASGVGGNESKSAAMTDPDAIVQGGPGNQSLPVFQGGERGHQQPQQKQTNAQTYSHLEQNLGAHYAASHSNPHTYSAPQQQQYTAMPPPPTLSTVAEGPSSSYVSGQGFSPMAGYGDSDVITMDMEINMHAGSGVIVDAGDGVENWWDQTLLPGLSVDLYAGARGQVGWNGQGVELGSGLGI
jgi:hypothetical protein